ncbi:MAG: serine hydrolase domain-containing protein, partial [Rhizomicrobium sp.]
MTKQNASIQGFDPRRLQRIDDVIARNYVETGALPGALTMVWRRGELVWRSASGVLDLGRGLPLREDSIFRLYSMTKPVTAAAMMVLWDRGLWSADDSIAKHLPEFAGVSVLGGGAPAHPPTLRELMTHTAGLGYGFD